MDNIDELKNQELDDVAGGAAASGLKLATFICSKCGTVFKKAPGVKMTGCGGKVDRIQ